MRLSQAKNVLVIVAHYDDEALFCGGTLLKLAGLDAKIHICVASHVKDTSFIAPGPEEEERQKARLQSARDVAKDLGATCYWLDVPNYRGAPRTWASVFDPLVVGIRGLITEVKPAVIITHAMDGDYGHEMHAMVHWAVRDSTDAFLAFDLNGGLKVPISWAQKKRLLLHYHESVVLGQLWEPWNDGVFCKWCGDYERFKPYGSAPLIWF